MSVALQQLVDEVVGAAEGNPEAAPEIYEDAANEFRSFARQKANARIAAALASRANEFEARAHHARSQRPATVDDFVEQEREHAQAHAEVGHLGDLEIKARRNEIHEARHGRKHVSITPESVTDKTPLGRTATVKFNPTNADVLNNIVSSSTVMQWQGVKTEAQTVTLDLTVNAFPAVDPTTPISCRPYAIITVGIDGNKTSFKVDVGLGVRLTLVANYVDVLVAMDAPFPGAAAGTMTIGASLGFFAAPSVAPVVLTSYIDQLGLGGSTLIAELLRPAKAVAILPPQSTDPGVNIQLTFFDYGNTQLYSLTFAVGTIVSPIPLANDVGRVRVTYQGALPSVNIRIPWQLST